jgi:ABC-type transporter Mla maintaining outer membrane lipid asymmetry ATPase subunit MlaF
VPPSTRRASRYIHMRTARPPHVPHVYRRAVVSDTSDESERVIMYDEPTAGLDPVASTVVEDLMRSLHGDSMAAAAATATATSSIDSSNGDAALQLPRGRMAGISSYIVVTHQHSTIRRAVDRIIFLHEGKVVWEGSVGEFDTTDEPIVRQFAEGSLKGPIAYL